MRSFDLGGGGGRDVLLFEGARFELAIGVQSRSGVAVVFFDDSGKSCSQDVVSARVEWPARVAGAAGAGDEDAFGGLRIEEGEGSVAVCFVAVNCVRTCADLSSSLV